MTSLKKFPGQFSGVACAYLVFIGAGFLISYAVSGGQPSCILVKSAIAQCLGIFFLCIQVSTNKNAAGISAKSLALDGFAIACRLSVTVWLNAYVPDDPTGDALYQSIETCSLILITWLFYQVTVTYRDTYQVTEDGSYVISMATGCLLLASALHTNLAERPFFDTMWMTGLFAGTIAVLPQLGLICKTGGRVQPLTSHYICALALSRVLSGVVMWLANLDGDLTSDPWIEGFNHGKWAILVAHGVQMLLVADFAYHYVQSAIRHGFRHTLELPTTDWGNVQWV
jgi:hypothetical protein